MKYLLLIMALLLALPPVQAGGCGVGGLQDPVQQSAGANHDCCPSNAVEDDAQERACEDGSHCAGCIITVAVVPLTLASVAHLRPLTDFTVPLPVLEPSHTLPPFRPPIS